MKRRFAIGAFRLASALSVMGAAGTVAPACNLGPFPAFLEELDPLDPVQGDVKGWILAQEDQTRVLVLSESGRYLHSIVEHNAAVRLEFGAFLIEEGEISFRSELRYTFPKESGGVNSRDGAQSEEVTEEERRAASLHGEGLTIDGWGTFISTDAYVGSLDLSSREGRGCLLKYVQLSIRTAQSRIRNLGSGGTVIYHNNRSTFSGFISGEQSIELENLLSPDTTISYDGFHDFPEVRLDGPVVSHVNTSGDGTLDEAVRIRIIGSGAQVPGGGGGIGGASAGTGVIAEGRIIYGSADPIEITQGDVTGGSYDLQLEFPSRQSDNFDWSFLEDLDLRGCYDVADFVDLSGE